MQFFVGYTKASGDFQALVQIQVLFCKWHFVAALQFEQTLCIQETPSWHKCETTIIYNGKAIRLVK